MSAAAAASPVPRNTRSSEFELAPSRYASIARLTSLENIYGASPERRQPRRGRLASIARDDLR
jgi:hypothetical protein